jgi:four helix bundle protein
MKDEKEIDLRLRTKRFALKIITLYSSLPKSTEAQVIGKQVLRSGTSVGANYREAYRARSDSEFISTLGVCLKELEETSYWLELLDESKIVLLKDLEFLSDECNQLTAIFTSIVKSKKKDFWFFIIYPSRFNNLCFIFS